MRTILFIHQSADLYGSDRMLLALVTKLCRTEFYPIVLLPGEGPLLRELRAAGVECHVVPIARLARATLSVRGLINLPAQIAYSLKEINKVLKGRKVDLVHSNTLAVLSGAIWARLNRRSHVWHVHEIIVHPVLVRKIFTYLLYWLADRVICVSHAARNNLLLDSPRLDKKISVVWNGMERPRACDKAYINNYRAGLGLSERDVLVALVGRINRLKGQRVLVEAAHFLWLQGIRNLRFLIVGSAVPSQEHFIERLQQDIAVCAARDVVVLKPFTEQVDEVWNACDIAVIPSTEPESFGLVALEAMAAGKPVVAANHGGLAEIVVDGETGVLVAPNDALALADAIRHLAEAPFEREQMGLAGKKRYEAEFTLDRFVNNVAAVYGGI